MTSSFGAYPDWGAAFATIQRELENTTARPDLRVCATAVTVVGEALKAALPDPGERTAIHDAVARTVEESLSQVAQHKPAILPVANRRAEIGTIIDPAFGLLQKVVDHITDPPSTELRRYLQVVADLKASASTVHHNPEPLRREPRSATHAQPDSEHVGVADRVARLLRGEPDPSALPAGGVEVPVDISDHVERVQDRVRRALEARRSDPAAAQAEGSDAALATPGAEHAERRQDPVGDAHASKPATPREPQDSREMPAAGLQLDHHNPAGGTPPERLRLIYPGSPEAPSLRERIERKQATRRAAEPEQRRAERQPVPPPPRQKGPHA